ncbi:MAG: hypothetical protein Q9203_002352, partial [Teloschistes exilis]
DGDPGNDDDGDDDDDEDKTKDNKTKEQESTQANESTKTDQSSRSMSTSLTSARASTTGPKSSSHSASSSFFSSSLISSSAFSSSSSSSTSGTCLMPPKITLPPDSMTDDDDEEQETSLIPSLIPGDTAEPHSVSASRTEFYSGTVLSTRTASASTKASVFGTRSASWAGSSTSRSPSSSIISTLIPGATNSKSPSGAASSSHGQTTDRDSTLLTIPSRPTTVTPVPVTQISDHQPPIPSFQPCRTSCEPAPLPSISTPPQPKPKPSNAVVMFREDRCDEMNCYSSISVWPIAPGENIDPCKNHDVDYTYDFTDSENGVSGGVANDDSNYKIAFGPWKSHGIGMSYSGTNWFVGVLTGEGLPQGKVQCSLPTEPEGDSRRNPAQYVLGIVSDEIRAHRFVTLKLRATGLWRKPRQVLSFVDVLSQAIPHKYWLSVVMSPQWDSSEEKEKDQKDGPLDEEQGTGVSRRRASIAEGQIKHSKLGWKRLTVCLIVEAIALGSLSMPSAFASLGMVAGVILTVSIGLIAIYTSWLVGQVRLKHPHVQHYADAVALMWGRFGYELTSVMFVLFLVLITGSHVLTGTIAWVRIIDETSKCALIWGFISAILLYLLALPPTFHEFAILGYIDFASIIVAILVTMVATGVAASRSTGGVSAVAWSAWPPADISFSKAFIATTNIVFAYSFAVCQYSFMSEMHTPPDYVKSIWALGIMEIFIYTLTGAIIYSFVGTDVDSPAILSAPTLVSRVAFGLALPVVFISGSINTTVVGKYIMGRVFPKSEIRYVNTKKGWMVWLALIAGLTLIAWVIAEAIPFFNDLLGIISSLFSSGFTFYFPALFWFYIIKEGKWNATRKNIALSMLNAVVLCIGLIVLVCGTYASIKDILDKYAKGSTLVLYLGIMPPGGRGSRWRGGGRRGASSKQPCRDWQKTGTCRFGAKCRYSHDTSSHSTDSAQGKKVHDQPQRTAEQQGAKDNYNAWKRYIKTGPKPNDTKSMDGLWSGALEILNDEDRDSKQMLPRDLDDQDLKGREHIGALLSMVSGPNGHGTLVKLAHAFLAVMTHPAILNCLSVDTAVGGLYNYISGSHGRRMVPFLQRLNASLIEEHLNPTLSDSSTVIENILTTMTTALCELLRREPRAALHDDLPDFIESVATTLEAIDVVESSVTHHLVRNGLGQLRGIVARARGLVQEEEQEAPPSGVTTSVVASTYPRDINMPRDRHDNDKTDITQIQILPSEDEIRSDHAPFLPSTDLNQPHFLTDGVARHLDTHFRLYRHDCFGDVSEAIGGAIHAIENDPTILADTKYGLGNIRAYTYPKAHVRYISFDKQRRLEAQLSFPQPPEARKNSSSSKLEAWWQDSKRLEEGCLLCLLFLDDGQASLLFLTVTEKCTDRTKPLSLSSNTGQATITAKLATGRETDLEKLIGLNGHGRLGLLVEFPDVLLATFVPILENLQNMQRLSRLPFRQWIIPEHAPGRGMLAKTLDIPPPLYARKLNFTFSLEPILESSTHEFSIRPRSIMDEPVDLGMLEQRTKLDRGQCEALVAALTREYAFIQGPPGTGKSYIGVQIMRVLQHCKSKAELGPIIVICYTNHALDQFLEHLVEVGMEKIIRIGGRSRSEVLNGKNLRVVSKGESKTKSESYELAMGYKALEEMENTIKKTLGTLHRVSQQPKWTAVQAFLARRYGAIHRQFSRVDEQGFESVGRDPFDIWLSQKSDVPAQQLPVSINRLLLIATRNVHSVLPVYREQLVAHWAAEIRADATDSLFESVKEANMLHSHRTAIHDDVDRRVLQTADVIGVTTTGLAKRIASLQHVKSKVVICEEAGEVLEPHVLSALLPSVEHFIQIGDHQQLRPQINNHKLSLESQQGALYQLDRSQFERLASTNGNYPRAPVAQLNVQRRMRPEISALIRQTLYPGLVDHMSTQDLPNVVGMRRNVVWLDHDRLQDGPTADKHAKSHSNLWEVEMVHALVRHLVRQGVYRSSDIAVLTPYTGQLQKLRNTMRNDFEVVLSDRDQDTLRRDGFEIFESSPEGTDPQSQPPSRHTPLAQKKMSELLRMATVDNFQGEEAKVVILSLVRSNKEKKIGFLRTSNRINVLLSRAKHGMYLLGNAETCSSQPMWEQILAMLGADGAVGKSLGLCCPRHTNTEMQVSEPDDFARLSPEDARHHVLSRWDAVINARERAASAGNTMTTINGKSNTCLAQRFVVDGSAHATTPVRDRVILIQNAVHVQYHARHQCPGLCGEECPLLYCQACVNKLDARVDLLEMKTYGEIDLDENPIVALACGHFFTAETLDGHLQMSSVYEQDLNGEYVALQDISAELAQAVPRCPDCQCPIRQYSTQRYNRMVNRAVMDETSKRFLVSGKDTLRALQHDLTVLEEGFEELDSKITAILGLNTTQHTASKTLKETMGIRGLYVERHAAVSKVRASIKSFCRQVSDKNQPAQKLHDAQIHALRTRSIDRVMRDVRITETVPNLPRDYRITMGASLMALHVDSILLLDSFRFRQRLQSNNTAFSGIKSIKNSEISDEDPSPRRFFEQCNLFIEQCSALTLPKFSVEAALLYARVARADQAWYHTLKTNVKDTSKYVEKAKSLLENATELCAQPFENAEKLRLAVQESAKLLRREWYEEVSAEERKAIRDAMFAIGECGMPMEEARCPECGAPVGGRGHRAVEGVTRAVEMER